MDQLLGFQGVWKLISITNSGREVHTSSTHLIIHPELLWEFVPGKIYYEGDKIGSTYSLIQKDGIGLLKVETDWDKCFCYFVVVNGNSLRMKLGSVFGDFPRDNGDEPDDSNVYLYERETDQELIAKLSSLPEKLPALTVEHPILGRLVYDANFDQWETTLTKSPFEQTLLTINDENAGWKDDHSFFNFTAELLDRLNLNEIKEFAATELLELKNECWLEEDEKELTRKDFADRLVQVEGITCYTSGSVSIVFDDNDLFWGHGITVEMDEHLNYLEAIMQ
ncbi:MAG: DUF2262 domain-containing protein [Fluviicola sp.]